MQWDEEAIKLDQLAAELRVSHSPAVQRNMEGDESMDGRNPLGLQGMSDNFGMSVETVHMEIEPGAGLNEDEEPINMFGGTEGLRSPYPTVTKKTSIFSVPTNMQEFLKSCFKLIVSGKHSAQPKSVRWRTVEA
jgi:hypothetical protein